jgi:hypothetical protein
VTGGTLSPSLVCLTLGRLFSGREALAALLFRYCWVLSFFIHVCSDLLSLHADMQGVGALTVNPFRRSSTAAAGEAASCSVLMSLRGHKEKAFFSL